MKWLERTLYRFWIKYWEKRIVIAAEKSNSPFAYIVLLQLMTVESYFREGGFKCAYKAWHHYLEYKHFPLLPSEQADLEAVQRVREANITEVLQKT